MYNDTCITSVMLLAVVKITLVDAYMYIYCTRICYIQILDIYMLTCYI